MNVSNFKYYFNNYYYRIYERLFPDSRSQKEAKFLTKFIKSKNSRILDFGCAWGRHLKALASMGYRDLIGVDFSDKLLDKARANLTNIQGAKLINTDLVSFKSNKKFDFIYHIFQSFGHEDKNYDQKTLLKVRKLLSNDGKYLLDLRNPIKLMNNEKFDLPGGVTVEAHYDKKRHREKFVYRFDREQQFVEFNVYTKQELTRMLQKAGLQLVKFFGDFSGIPYGVNSERLIIVAKKAKN